MFFGDLATRAGSMTAMLESWGRLDEVVWPAARMVIEGGMTLPDADYWRKFASFLFLFRYSSESSWKNGISEKEARC